MWRLGWPTKWDICVERGDQRIDSEDIWQVIAINYYSIKQMMSENEERKELENKKMEEAKKKQEEKIKMEETDN